MSSRQQDEVNRALFEGNRSKVERMLKGKASTSNELWLFANATEDEQERQTWLTRVVMTKKQPYASMARDILRREQQFAEEIARPPGWQAWLTEKRYLIIGVIALLILIAVLLIIADLFFNPPLDPAIVAATSNAKGTQIALQATETVIAARPTVPPTVTAVPANNVVDYPYGQLIITGTRIVGASEVVVQGDNAERRELPAGFEYYEVRYTFTCGGAMPACTAPEAAASLELSNGGLQPDEGYRLETSSAQGVIPPGQSVNGAFIFRKPTGVQPVALVLVAGQQGGQDTRIIRLSIVP